MIYQINKYHRTEAGETASTVKVEKADATAAYEDALKQFYQTASNYMADQSVLAWNLTVICPSDMTEKAHLHYTRPVPVAEPTE